MRKLKFRGGVTGLFTAPPVPTDPTPLEPSEENRKRGTLPASEVPAPADCGGVPPEPRDDEGGDANAAARAGSVDDAYTSAPAIGVPGHSLV